MWWTTLSTNKCSTAIPDKWSFADFLNNWVFCFHNVIHFFYIFPFICDIPVWNWSSNMDSWPYASAPWVSLTDTQTGGLYMRLEYRKRFPRHRLQRNLQVSDPGMHHGPCVMHLPWCMSASLTRGGEINVLGIPGSCVTHVLTYLVRGPWDQQLPISSYQ